MKRVISLPVVVALLAQSLPSSPDTPTHWQDDGVAAGLEGSVLLAQANGEPPDEYTAFLHTVDAKREQLRHTYSQAKTKAKRQTVLDEAKQLLFNSLVTHVFPAWYGTTWDFNGTSETPGEGEIACGYFVTTTLRDAGFNLPRVRLAQQPAEHIIKNLVGKDHIRRYSDASVRTMEQEIRAWGPGLYVVGLDIHVGFLVNNGLTTTFVHSSYYNPPKSVVSEPIGSRNPFADSRYRVIGKLDGDNETIRKWLFGERFPVKYDYFETK
ncbi:hypothetical protein HYS47_01070 [Candidatus Woesearchaeota archaeon]|nr:hypothetical protein [Candidatus Woesearchaeota archaeon]